MANASDHDDLPNCSPAACSAWAARYGGRHRWERLSDFPPGIRPPDKVRVYRRADHYILSWWDKGAKRNLAERVDGDLLAALMRARQIDERLSARGTGGTGRPGLSHDELAERFQADLRRRADAGELSPASVRRYQAALAHYRRFVGQPQVSRDFPSPARLNRDFRLAFEAHLSTLEVRPNGHPHSEARPLRGQAFVADVVRAMLEWASDPERGALLPQDFRNPFARSARRRAVLQGDPLAEPDITLGMGTAFVRACDRYQLRLFVPLLLFGLRAAEPAFLFSEYVDRDWLRVPCSPDLCYLTKGGRDKRFPLVDALRPFWAWLVDGRPHGLLYQRRAVLAGRETAPWGDASREELVAEFRRRCAGRRPLSAEERLRARDQLLREAGGVNYDHLEQEFRALAGRLSWPRQATLKDFRHLFSTMLSNAAIPEYYRTYLMGHAPGKAAIAVYTHLDQLRRHFGEAVRREWQPLVEAVLGRLATLQAEEGGQGHTG